MLVSCYWFYVRSTLVTMGGATRRKILRSETICLLLVHDYYCLTREKEFEQQYCEMSGKPLPYMLSAVIVVSYLVLVKMKIRIE